jgi:protein-S-isoprenylcysteine O-methyltransferase Ste14
MWLAPTTLEDPMVRTLATLTVGLGSYLLFLVTTIYGITFTLGGVLPVPVALPRTPWLLALLIDVGLIALFGVQHSLMARPRWKQKWTSIIPPALERSLYVLLASCILLALFWLWQPLPTVIWQIDNPLFRVSIYGVCLAGWAIVVLSTFQIDHFELFGLRQVWRTIHNQPQVSPEFRLPFLYRLVRHPMMSGFLLAFWATPHMTVDRILFALGMSLYILLGLSFEERALRREFAQVYEKYRAEVPRLFPLPRLVCWRTLPIGWPRNASGRSALPWRGRSMP